jgi:hypothetical protein
VSTGSVQLPQHELVAPQTSLMQHTPPNQCSSPCTANQEPPTTYPDVTLFRGNKCGQMPQHRENETLTHPSTATAVSNRSSRFSVAIGFAKLAGSSPAYVAQSAAKGSNTGQPESAAEKVQPKPSKSSFQTSHLIACGLRCAQPFLETQRWKRQVWGVQQTTQSCNENTLSPASLHRFPRLHGRSGEISASGLSAKVYLADQWPVCIGWGQCTPVCADCLSHQLSAPRGCHPRLIMPVILVNLGREAMWNASQSWNSTTPDSKPLIG